MSSGDYMDEMFGELRSLSHRSAPVDSGTWRALLAEVRRGDPERYDARWLPYLSRVELPTFTVGSFEEWRELLECLPAGVSLRLMGRFESDDTIASIAAHEGSSKLARLDLSGAEIGDAGLDRLLRAEWFGGLAALDLRKNGITGAAIEVFVRTRWSALERLVLSGNALGDPALASIARGLDAPKLAWLDVSSNPHGLLGAAELRESARLEHVFVVT